MGRDLHGKRFGLIPVPASHGLMHRFYYTFDDASYESSNSTFDFVPFYSKAWYSFSFVIGANQ